MALEFFEDVPGRDPKLMDVLPRPGLAEELGESAETIMNRWGKQGNLPRKLTAIDSNGQTAVYTPERRPWGRVLGQTIQVETHVSSIYVRIEGQDEGIWYNREDL